MAETDRAASVVCDAGPLIHLDELGCLDLLRDFAHVQVPDAVWSEVRRHQPAALRRRSVKLVRASALPLPTPELVRLTLDFLLEAGEVDALRLMQAHPGAILLTDDLAARVVAGILRYEVHGTIGIIVRAIRRGQRSKRQALNLLRTLPRKSTLHIEQRLLQSVIEAMERS